MDKGPYGRRDRLIVEKEHDTYRQGKKWPEGTICTACGAVFTGGRWSWQDAPARANEVICPACRRIEDKYPAGFLEINGSFFPRHREEILGLLNNEEKIEKEEHPLERIMAVEEDGEKTMVTTTGIHIARRLGEALVHAYQGDLSITYGDGEKTIRLVWQRD